jgi:hypothetical protein
MLDSVSSSNDGPAGGAGGDGKEKSDMDSGIESKKVKLDDHATRE